MSLPKLAKLDAKTIDISKIEIAVRIPQEFRIRDDKAVLDLQINNKQTGDKAVERVDIPRRSRPLTKVLKRKMKDGMKIYQFSLAEDDVETGVAFRKKAIALDETAEGNTSVTVGVSAHFCIEKNGDPNQDLRMTFYLRTDPENDFYTLFKEQTLPFRDENGERQSSQICKDDTDRSKLSGPL